MNDPFTIRIHLPNGDPEDIRVIDRLGWTGVGIAFPRVSWSEVRSRSEFSGPGVYILVGYSEDTSDELPTIYVGKGTRDVRSRVEEHTKGKEFWDSGVVFSSSNGELNTAHVDWLEYALVDLARKAGQSHLDNDVNPRESGLGEADKAYTRSFLKEILQILPLLGIHSFEKPKTIIRQSESHSIDNKRSELDTVIVPAHDDGFEEVFLGEGQWRSIRISGGMLNKIHYIAAYRTLPTMAITHYAVVKAIESFGEHGKYRLLFDGRAMPIGPIKYGNMPKGSMQGPRYTTFEKLKAAKTLKDLW